MKRVANRDCYSYVERQEEFNGSNLFARWHGNVYVVYSFGMHYPIFLWIDPEKPDGGWYENNTVYSKTTTKHQTQARPIGVPSLGIDIKYRSTQELKKLIHKYIAN